MRTVTKGKYAPKKRVPVAIREVAGQVGYLESSALVAALLEHDAGVLAVLSAPGHRVTSALTFAEATRAIVRAQVAKRISWDQVRAALDALRAVRGSCSVIGISEAILARAGNPFPVEPVRTLDAIHLASIELLGGPPQMITVYTRDARVRENATALGYLVA